MPTNIHEKRATAAYCGAISPGGSALSLNGGSSFGRRGKIIVEVGMIPAGGGGGFAGAIAAIPGRFSILWGWTV